MGLLPWAQEAPGSNPGAPTTSHRSGPPTGRIGTIWPVRGRLTPVSSANPEITLLAPLATKSFNELRTFIFIVLIAL